MKTPYEALRSTCLIEREKRGRCVWNFTKFSTKNMLAIKSRNRFGEEFVITKNASKGANRSEKIVLNSSEMKRKNRAV